MPDVGLSQKFSGNAIDAVFKPRRVVRFQSVCKNVHHQNTYKSRVELKMLLNADCDVLSLLTSPESQAKHARVSIIFVLQKPDMISVSAQRFHDRLRRPDATYRDVIRIFLKYGDSMLDDEVDDVIISHVKSHTPQRKTMAATGRLHMGESASKNADDAENRLVGELPKHLLFKCNPISCIT